jgi:hypothetical protein
MRDWTSFKFEVMLVPRLLIFGAMKKEIGAIGAIFLDWCIFHD